MSDHDEEKAAVPEAANDSNLRKFTAGVCWFQVFISGIFYGISPLALPISTVFVEDGDDKSLDSGLVFYGFALLMAFQSWASCVAIFRVEQMALARKKQAITGAYLMWPLGWAALALGVQIKSRALVLAGFPLLGVSIGVQVGYVYLVLTSIMWGDRVHIGASIGGGFSAVGALIWNCVFGEVVHALGFERVNISMWIFCGLQSAGVLIGVVFLNPARYLIDTSGSQSQSEGKDSQLSTVTKSMTLNQLLRDWRVYVFVFIVQAFFFAGLSMKTLMSELFEKLLRLEYIEAVRYSSACLSAYVVARFAAPLMASGDRVFAMFAGVLATEGIAYALTPWAISLNNHSVIVYTCFRLVGGIGFAMLKSSTTVLLVNVFGPENVAKICGMFLAAESLMGIGPSIAFSLHISAVSAGTPTDESYDIFFYFCSAMVLIGMLGTLVLRWTKTRLPEHQKDVVAAKATGNVDDIPTTI